MFTHHDEKQGSIKGRYLAFFIDIMRENNVWNNKVLKINYSYPLNYHTIVNVSHKLPIVSIFPLNYQTISMYPKMTNIPFIKLYKNITNKKIKNYLEKNKNPGFSIFFIFF
jgi:hypothetical protein